jgi:pantoate--beta-alanine ligase
MGALHEGHAALIRRARKLAGKNGSVVVSIFVNPKQFGPKEDLSKYPRPFTKDRELCAKEGVDLLFHPSVNSMYEGNASIAVTENSLSRVLCGVSRPGHFDGVCTVVTMLFNLIDPNIAVFGEKDWQQLAVIKRMVRDLKTGVKIQAHPTVREDDGLALSSRNRLLSPKDRQMAPRIYQALQTSVMEAEEGFSMTVIKRRLRDDLAAIPGAVIDYVEIMDEMTLAPLKKPIAGVKARVFVALRFGSVRLIDNISIKFFR